jgi:hypothetical protein
MAGSDAATPTSAHRRYLVAGALGLFCFVAHGAVHVARHEAYEMLWTCNASALVIGLAGLLRSRTGLAIGLCWLSIGVPLWLVDLAGGGELMPSSILTHVVGPLGAILALVRVGWPPSAWWKAATALTALLGVTRLATPAKANVNLAFRVWPGWEALFPNHVVYLVALMLLCCALFFGVERVARRPERRGASARAFGRAAAATGTPLAPR